MDVQDYRAAGYGLSQVYDQAKVTRAENDVVAAYIVPLVGHVPTAVERATEPLKTAIMSLSFLLIQQRNAVVTRSGAKVKLAEQSSTPNADDVLRQNAPSCAAALRAIAGGKKPYKECSDICGIFFSSYYFSLH